MRQDYLQWLEEQKYAEGTQSAQIHRVKKVEEFYGDLEEHFRQNTLQDVINSLQYSVFDERARKPNPSKIVFNGNIRNNLQSYKNAVVRYEKFLGGGFFEREFTSDNVNSDIENQTKQKFSLERDMQSMLRNNITQLDENLRIIDDGAERSVDSGFIDITCEDDEGIVIVELKAGKVDSRAIGQILGYMGDTELEEDRPVRGILIAHDFDKRTKAAARIVPSLELRQYSIEFKFTSLE
ncbi:endonuclease NucS domain-containing protein [Hirschia baltica]|uniref:Endonuclease NucS C-terminal domain-containing protein n=1 Tax=Hirschia baltica (strain ATCC 49814 / DSM 5838 / IFAM 1418) TaxID=582402 RepID=C6XRV6_HIRBI|nr:endonuclease NucS domain-containing protein [Hirschia baltica]ACT60716.1 hypothetical protein Hbal_3048 [Hirschia baltica ATCC 49814]